MNRSHPKPKNWAKRVGPQSWDIWNDREHRWERFDQVIVGRQAIHDWLDERWASAGRGYPNRPPDIDTKTMRSWLREDGEMIEVETDPGAVLLEGEMEGSLLVTRQLRPGSNATYRIAASKTAEGWVLKARTVDELGEVIGEHREVYAEQQEAFLKLLWVMASVTDHYGPAPHTIVTGADLIETRRATEAARARKDAIRAVAA